MLSVEELTDRLIDLSFAEDIGDGDHTTLCCIPADAMGESKLLVKQPGIIAGVEVAKVVFHRFDPTLQVEVYINDGAEVKPGDIVVVFDSQKGKGRKVSHLLYGWGKVTSDVIFDKNDDNPIHRMVEWHKPLPQKPIEEDMTSNTRYFHQVKGAEADNIMNLLGINEEDMMSTKKNYWLVGYYIDDKSELDDLFAKNEWRAWFGERDANQFEQAKSRRATY